MAQVQTRFDCKHEALIEVDVDGDVEIPQAAVRGLGKCPDCRSEKNLIAVSGVAPQGPRGRVVLDSIMMMPLT
ncbi:MAG: hypothetical protein ACR2GA_02485 [Chloroflexota bacterium]